MLAPSDAHAAFPGANGKIAFTFDDEDENVNVYTVNPDGSGRGPVGGFSDDASWSPDGSLLVYDDTCCNLYAHPPGGGETWLSSDPASDDLEPAWSPDGSKIAFVWAGSIAAMDADGADRASLGVAGSRPAWSPDGTKIAFDRGGEIFTINADGSGETQLTTNAAFEHQANWSPDGSRIVFDSNRDGNLEIYAMNANGTAQTRLTTNAVIDQDPAWSPDGTKIVFSHSTGTSGRLTLWVMNADGSVPTQVTTTGPFGGNDFHPDWQPILHGYVRPKVASPTYLSLVPAYQPCASPNRTHGPPLSFDACAPPAQSSTQLTVGTADSNGQPTKSIGYVRVATILGDPSTPADEADLSLAAAVTDVRNASDLSDYGGALEARLPIRITDKDNSPAPGGPGPGTVADSVFSFSVPCTTTPAGNVGSSCSVITTADAVLSGAIVEKMRTVWQLDGAELRDGNGDVFLTQGLFIP